MKFRWMAFLSLITIACTTTHTHQSNSASEPDKILNILDIAGQTQEDIATILGHQSQLDAESAARSGCPTCQKYSYKDDLVKIVYINDMADWITITPPAAFRARDTPALLGLPDAEPDYTDQKVLRWKGYEGIQEIGAFRKPDGTLDYIYLRVTTP